MDFTVVVSYARWSPSGVMPMFLLHASYRVIASNRCVSVCVHVCCVCTCVYVCCVCACVVYVCTCVLCMRMCVYVCILCDCVLAYIHAYIHVSEDVTMCCQLIVAARSSSSGGDNSQPRKP